MPNLSHWLLGINVTDIIQASASLAMVGISIALVKVGKAQVRTAQALERIASGTERAYVTMSEVDDGLTIPDVEPRPTTNFGLDRQDVTLTLELKNSGRTAARITAVAFNAVGHNLGDPMPDPPAYGAPYRWLSILVNGETHRITETLRLRWLETELLREGRSTLLLIGYVDYEDMFGRKYRYGYARRASGRPEQPRVGEHRYDLKVEPNPAYTYERERV